MSIKIVKLTKQKYQSKKGQGIRITISIPTEFIKELDLVNIPAASMYAYVIEDNIIFSKTYPEDSSPTEEKIPNKQTE